MTKTDYRIGDRVQVVGGRLRRRVGEPASGRIVNPIPRSNEHELQVHMDWTNTECDLWFSKQEIRHERWYDWFLSPLRRFMFK